MAEKHADFRAQHVGQTLPVLVETGRRGGEPRLGGWTDNYLRVELGSGEAPSRVLPVLITGMTDSALAGRLVGKSEPV